MTTYKKLTWDSYKIQVESAVRDGNGATISTTYATKTDVASTYATQTALSNGLAAKADDSDVVHKTGTETIPGSKTFSAKPTMSAGLDITGTLNVTGDINQNGSTYETHAQQVYTADDYIIMRDGAVAGLGAGDYAGFQVKKYDGTNDGRLVIDNTGTARVGDVGDEQPLLTREESANLNNGALLKWDSANAKAVDEGTVGSDTKPIKIVNGVATEVSNELATKNSVYFVSGETFTSGSSIVVSGFIAGSQTGAYVEFPLWKSCENVTPTVTVTGFSLRGITASETKTISAVSVAKSTPGLLRLGLTFSSATSNPINSPITAFIDLSITFS